MLDSPPKGTSLRYEMLDTREIVTGYWLNGDWAVSTDPSGQYSIQGLVFQRIKAHNDIVHKRHQPLRSGRCLAVSLSLFSLTSAVVGEVPACPLQLKKVEADTFNFPLVPVEELFFLP